ncbi:hypothetical protein D9756_008654 [Leucocoprinus leucothites]|uniref:F-box domain-containing protein n=1 Tax=Leucocoprinus leucothites TaxID=201217 RepID=A0A8H5CZ09_9AGAR|nr:hypothetical protein D9756_008654 [Leucoagaricus leucothites]
MFSGPELPLELLPVILEHLPKVHYLTRAALVNHAFYQSTIPLLYSRASIYSWHKDAKSRVIELFRTLSSCSHLARYVRRLEIRDFPRNSLSDDVLESISQGLRNCTNLRSCTWTRDGSLTSDILLALSNPFLSTNGVLSVSSMPEPVHALRELEINGHHSKFYDPKLLLRFKWLERITIIMPTIEVVHVLEEWVKIVQESLRSLNVICKMSPVITDEVLIRIAPYLKNLEFFHLTGCPKVTHRGVRAVLSESERGIQNMALESVSPRLDLTQLLPMSISHPRTLHNLHSLTLSIPPLHSIPVPTMSSLASSPSSTMSLAHLPHTPPTLQSYTTTLLRILTHHTPNLERFQMYSPHMFFEPCVATSELFLGLVKRHGERLKRISVHRMLIGLDVIKNICTSCPVMEEFFVVVEPGGLDTLADHIHHAKSLRTIHVNYPLEAHAEDGGVPVLRLDEALRFVKRANNPRITQFGCNALGRLQVYRKVVVSNSGDNADGERGMECEVYLGPYESPDIPEQFMVVRT